MLKTNDGEIGVLIQGIIRQVVLGIDGGKRIFSPQFTGQFKAKAGSTILRVWTTVARGPSSTFPAN